MQNIGISDDGVDWLDTKLIMSVAITANNQIGDIGRLKSRLVGGMRISCNATAQVVMQRTSSSSLSV